MSGFYRQLKEAMKSEQGDIYTETVLRGVHAGEKRILQGNSLQDAGEREEDGGDVFRERIGRQPKLIICGAGHVSVPIIKMGKMLGFAVTVLEDRPRFADNARAAGADTVICEAFEKALEGIHGDSDSWFVIVTRGHRYDTICLENILHKTYAYVGMMGSRRRVAIVKDQLEESGISRETLDAVHTPIGLKIGAETPEEIAVSVMAEIIQVKNSREKGGGYSGEMLGALVSEEGRKKVVATIVSRKGSAPRSVGTKMLIFEDGTTVDTIGGGCVESEIMQKALLMMRAGEPRFQVCRVDMTSDAAEDEGMVCGGVVEVMMEASW
ncbi:MAG TPA: XdhC family protein [Candidatus Mediterraneibacter intestinavium]|nr:XdhC family protein [Candidatus Mediterraneibacter stercoripullorum]HJB82796.1 XdhC family protein [Candidatus Mediterraneibacter intestinavium]